jgi:hypothetical protein
VRPPLAPKRADAAAQCLKASVHVVHGHSSLDAPAPTVAVNVLVAASASASASAAATTVIAFQVQYFAALCGL